MTPRSRARASDFAPPELMTGKSGSDARADVFGLGMTAVFMIYGDSFTIDAGPSAYLDQRTLQLPESEHGWLDIEELSHALGDSRNALNLNIYRARSQFREETEICDATGLIERRRRSKIRIGISQLEVIDVASG